jgi:Lrp/AsnC family leucine-responsive transcriptional regulator
MDLDRIDQEILGVLENNARITASALAATVGLSRSAAQERIRKLEDAGEIQAYTITRKTPKSADRLRAYLLIKTTGALCHQIAPILEKYPEVKSFESISGDIDALVCVETLSSEALANLRDEIASLHQVSDIQTLSVLKTRIEWR